MFETKTFKGQMWIGGKFCDAKSGKTLKTINPATEEELAEVPYAGKEDVDAAVAAARAAFPIWSGMPLIARSMVLFEMAAKMREHHDELVEIEVLEHGTPVTVSHGFMGMAPGLLEYAAGACRTIMGEQIPIDNTTIGFLQKAPLGVIGLIIPWNLPIVVACAKMGGCIGMGNTCILKGPKINSMHFCVFAKILSEVKSLPAGVVNIITGPGGSVGDAIVRHPGVDGIGMTGSSMTGKILLAAAADTVKKCSMELGGKNPAFILKDADVDQAVHMTTGMQFNNCGQHCSSVGRYYVHEAVYDEFVEKMCAVANSVVCGDPQDPKTMMGPVVSQEHYDDIMGYINGAVADGAKIVAGGGRVPGFDKGFFIQPTVIIDCKHEMTCAREEIFGPVVIIIKLKDGDDVVKLANDSRYGLACFFYSKDVAKAMDYIPLIESGNVFVNTHILTGEMPWGSDVKDSGLGREGALAGIQDFTQHRMVIIRHSPGVTAALGQEE